ncbi:Uma2 family endonuclease [Streptomyces sp. UNOC14_S4]|uniref:Uma2 family endonuclease n=1 Tax=Streptomyces sp. UNOC14_S4 TaxID=2872340 RepID=UPI001E5CF893|nr:Uma2 family endonuclease [Streptomyces sp. UNOC14_S4]MCC3770056.1 Uma2 family endonuclease [Streptomyces sp. UNOC14_S4]
MDIPREVFQPIADEGDIDFEQLCRDLEQANDAMPDGYRAEIIGGNIVMSPWSKGSYFRILRSLEDQLSAHTPPGHRAMTNPHLFVFPQQSRAYGPDLHVADLKAIDIDTIRLPGSALSLVAEQTSPSTRLVDLTDKLGVYGRAEVPVYILIDMAKDMVTVYYDPTPDHGYLAHRPIKFGDKVHIPAPFDFELDTAGW